MSVVDVEVWLASQMKPMILVAKSEAPLRPAKAYQDPPLLQQGCSAGLLQRVMFEGIQQQENSVIFEKHIQSIQSCAIVIRKQHSEDFIPVAWKKYRIHLCCT
jgi:hypothetical protein